MDGQATLTGLKDAMAAMEAAFPKDPEQQRRLVTAAMRQSALETIVVEAKLRAAAGEGSGALAASIGVRAVSRRKVLTRRLAAGVEVAPIRYDPTAMTRYINFYGAKLGKIDGIRHGHLVEFGHRTRDGNGWVAAHPFLWPAATSKGGAYTRRFAQVLKPKVEAAVKRRARNR